MASGAGEGNRTPTPLREPDFESGASASFATPARWAILPERTRSGARIVRHRAAEIKKIRAR